MIDNLKSKKTFFISIIFILFFKTVFSQPNTKNSHLQINMGIITYGSIQIGYDYFFDTKSNNQIGSGVTLGAWYNLDLFGFLKHTDGIKSELSFIYLRHGENVAFELETGVVFGKLRKVGSAFENELGFFPSHTHEYHIFPKLQLGFRNYFKNSPLFFRMAFGVPETVELGFGLVF